MVAPVTPFQAQAKPSVMNSPTVLGSLFGILVVSFSGLGPRSLEAPVPEAARYPRRDLNAGHRLRRPVLYPLSYGGVCGLLYHITP